MGSRIPSIAEVAGDAGRFTDYSVPDAGIRAIYTQESIWQAWLDVEVALAQAEAELGVVPADAAARITEVARLENLDLGRVVEGMRIQGHPLMPLIEELVRVAGEPRAGGCTGARRARTSRSRATRSSSSAPTASSTSSCWTASNRWPTSPSVRRR
ncbi:hypothetical protein [Microbacterium sp. Marseille-Q6965]|uniref:hypothetical protein n=1 Tax=Microbacterium sp. Marseille-Q6965 TaxID=2965072 RepID=UPI0021B787EF|nr:hypothetical protein [Microbacterium sp. Marseille-Q6965]